MLQMRLNLHLESSLLFDTERRPQLRPRGGQQSPQQNETHAFHLHIFYSSQIGAKYPTSTLGVANL